MSPPAELLPAASRPAAARRTALADAVLGGSLRLTALVAGTVVVLIAVFLLHESLPAFAAIGVGRFFTDPSWHPQPRATNGTFLLVPMVMGTLWATLGAVLLATPVGILAALFTRFVAPAAVARVFRRLVELLAGIPSVVYGFWGLTVLVPLIRRIEPPGPSLLAGVLVLAIMILPTVALSAEAALAAVPRAHFEAAAALGLTRARTILSVALPAARPAILTGVLLQTGRALGETMAVLMVCGNIVRHPQSVFEPVRTLTANIALEMGYAAGDHRAALFVTGLLLLALVALLVAAAEGLAGGPRHA